jgi:hypothetical protein
MTNLSEKEKQNIKEMYGLIEQQTEPNRIINLYQIGNKNKIDIIKSQGLVPYYFDSKINGEYKMVEIDKNNFSKLEKIGRVFLLTPDELEKINKLMGLEEKRFAEAQQNLITLNTLQKELNQSASIGAMDAMEQLSKQFEPYQMAQDAILQGWNRIGSAIDNFVQTGKFKFSEFARSVLQDLLSMIIRAQVFQAISASMGFFGLTVPGLAKGGPAAANQPYIVGEQGPELFVPKTAGTVIPNDRLMGGQQSIPSATMQQPAVNNYITNNISALDSKSVAQVFAENRQALLGTVQVAQREQPF